MLYIFILTLVIISLCIFILFIIIFQKHNRKIELSIKENLSLHEEKIFNNSDLFKNNIAEHVNNIHMNSLLVKEYLEKEMVKFAAEISNNLNKGLRDTNSSFYELKERLTKIDSTQQKLDNLTGNILTLTDIFSDKKFRGIYGEMQLNRIVKNIFGENSIFYKEQHKLSNNNVVDMIFFLSDNYNEHVCIDSKFPLDNYRKYMDCTNKNDLNIYKKKFKLDLKRHIDVISSKYIIENETATYAIMFIPAEAIFAFVNSQFLDIIDYSYKKNIWITSPTTLIAMLNILSSSLRDKERMNNFLLIKTELSKISDEFNRFNNRWGNLVKDINKVLTDIKEIDITSKKIQKNFDCIDKLDFVEK